MTAYGVVAAAGTVRFERVLPGPIERVWACLTESETRGRWLASGAMELRIGGRVALRFRHADLSREAEPIPARYARYAAGHGVHGSIIGCDPPRLLSFTWGDESGDPSEVAFDLAPREGGVHLVLTHRRLGDRATTVSIAAGWHTHLDILADVLIARAPGTFWSTHQRLEREYERRFAPG